ncbi:sulfur oxidation c-type cytochrome SoxA [Shinella sp.]|uniref:sulfur oxidation c-type cytochrome SoxA n=1 Tax=Shinella sp. TaxID=1870904 RepID=UPI003F6E80DA
MRRVLALVVAIASTAAGAGEVRAPATFLSPEQRALQDDPSRHPGWLWVDAGETLWRSAPPTGRPSCQGCHGEIATMRGVATRYPAVAPSGELVNLEGRIETCRSEKQQAPAFGYESEHLLSLTAAIALQSRGLPMAVATEGPAARFVSEGRRLYTMRQGQLNLSCAQCHDENVGRRLRGDVISSGVGTGYPAYRLEWNRMGSLHRRLRACSLGVRATQFDYGASEYLALELYLAVRAGGLPIETPGLRR